MRKKFTEFGAQVDDHDYTRYLGADAKKALREMNEKRRALYKKDFDKWLDNRTAMRERGELENRAGVRRDSHDNDTKKEVNA